MAETTGDAERLAHDDIWNKQEFSRVSDVVAELLPFTSPTSGTVQGRENFTAYAAEIVDAFPDFQRTVHELLVGEDVIMAEGTLSGTQMGSLMAVRRRTKRSQSGIWRGLSSKTANYRKNVRSSITTTCSGSSDCSTSTSISPFTSNDGS